jgi:broad specificity phosphatase PhoE
VTGKERSNSQRHSCSFSIFESLQASHDPIFPDTLLRRMRQLTLVRHGITDWNVTGKFQGHSDTPLSEDGRTQAHALAKHLKKAKVDVIYSSPLSRALETAMIVFPNREIIQDDRLRELNFGVFESFTQAENLLHEEWAWWFADPFKRPAPNGESYEALRLRAVAWMESLPDNIHVAAFTHSGTIQMLVSHVLGLEYPKWRKRIYLRHTGITRILFRQGEAVIERVNDTRHLAKNGDVDPFAE